MDTFTKGKVNLYQGDCMKLMESKPDNYYDLAVVDPEFGINASSMTMGSGKNKKYIKKKWDTKPPPKEYFIELFRVPKNQIICGGNYFADKLPISKGWMFWDKGINGETTFADGELIWTSFDTVVRKANVRYKGFLGADITRIHITQKPVKLYDWIFHNYAKPEFKIVDTHGGSMSSAIAAYYFGCEFDCIELDEDYYNDAVKRFKQMTMQTKLF